MPRGRSKDTTLPLTRALTAQRSYRARKAAHLQTLEDEVQQLRDENAALRDQVHDLRRQLGSQDRTSDAGVIEAAREEIASALRRLDSLQPLQRRSHMGASRERRPPTPATSQSSRSPPAASARLEVFDPECCDGVFDCSGLSMPVSDMRSAPPLPPAKKVDVAFEPQADACCLGVIDCGPSTQGES